MPRFKDTITRIAHGGGRPSDTDDSYNAHPGGARSPNGINCTTNVESGDELCDLKPNLRDGSVLDEFRDRKRRRNDETIHMKRAELVAHDDELCDFEISETRENEKGK